MKQQYFGDVSDYRKYGLLRCLSEVGLRVGVLWMLTADEGRNDGQRIAYLRDPGKWRRFDPILFDFLAEIVFLQGRRDIAVLENSTMLPRASYYGTLLTDSAAERSRYYRDALAALAQADLVFFDPDNGLEVPSVRYGAAGSRRYLYWGEVEEAWAAGYSLLIFQHFNREARQPFTQRLSAQLHEGTPGSHVVVISTSHVLFLVAAQQRHLEPLHEGLQLVSQRWASQVTMTQILRPNSPLSGQSR